MPTDPSQYNGSSRLDRIEAGLERLEAGHEKFQYEHNQLLKAQVLLTDYVEKVTSRVDRLTDRVDRLTDRVDRLTDLADWLTDGIRELQELQRKASTEMAALRDREKHTDERLNTLITVMDDWIRRQPPPQPN